MTTDAAAAPASQTLSRGIRILEILADAREPLSIDEIARRLDVHRSVAYRLLRTLEDHGLVDARRRWAHRSSVRAWRPSRPASRMTCRPRRSPSSPRSRTSWA